MASSCVLRATGIKFDCAAFMRESGLEVCNIYYSGERRSANSVWETSGITVDVSSADEFEVQVADAIHFLERNRGEIERLREFPGVEALGLDFGVNTDEDIFCRSYSFRSN